MQTSSILDPQWICPCIVSCSVLHRRWFYTLSCILLYSDIQDSDSKTKGDLFWLPLMDTACTRLSLATRRYQNHQKKSVGSWIHLREIKTRHCLWTCWTRVWEMKRYLHNLTYIYTLLVLMSLGKGPCKHIGNCWILSAVLHIYSQKCSPYLAFQEPGSVLPFSLLTQSPHFQGLKHCFCN